MQWRSERPTFKIADSKSLIDDDLVNLGLSFSSWFKVTLKSPNTAQGRVVVVVEQSIKVFQRSLLVHGSMEA